ncbi:hypothetical protein BCR39DRAFT_562360 [Naematelia encephala]|uniref:Transcription initiation factor IIE subunit beta n=1 Tax=Naematelia encephala TaxID=71784 RepID=A0A1Y2AJL9_9TREE|nr:hypothetical protein BCR39DRAFT_562360 [Naematelia encephala]
MSLKRKSGTLTHSASPKPSIGIGAGVKAESLDSKRPRTDASGLGPTRILSSTHGRFQHVDTAALELRDRLKSDGTINLELAVFQITELSPHLDASAVIERFKKLEKVDFNPVNGVFTYIYDQQYSTLPDIRTALRTKSTLTSGVEYSSFRSSLAPGAQILVDQLEREGQILIMRSLKGQYMDAPLPPLGRANMLGLRITDHGAAGIGSRWRSIWWDDTRERGRAGQRVDEDFVAAWADVPIAEADDVERLLAAEDLSASSTAPPPVKINAGPAIKKKKRSNRPLKITNTHMKQQGIDFSKDYEPPA